MKDVRKNPFAIAQDMDDYIYVCSNAIYDFYIRQIPGNAPFITVYALFKGSTKMAYFDNTMSLMHAHRMAFEWCEKLAKGLDKQSALML